MRHTGKRLLLSCLALSAAVLCTPKAEARSHVRHTGRLVRTSHLNHRYYHRHVHVIQCVAYVHQSTDFKIRGNARDWWQKAKGLYARGNQPEAGAVLAFRSTRRMPLGHVAVVRKQIDSRTIMIDQSHWASNGISHNTRVVDVSPDNSWTAVRVAIKGSGGERLGSIYPTHGFIYHRAEGSLPLSTMARNVVAHGNASDMETASVPSGDNVFGDEAPSRSLQ